MVEIKGLKKYDNCKNIFSENEENKKLKEEWLKKTRGERDLIQDYLHTRRDDRMITDYLVIQDVVWEEELEEYLEALKKYKIDKFVYADTSTACFRTIIFFLNKGAKITPIEYKTEFRFGEEDTKATGMLIEL